MKHQGPPGIAERPKIFELIFCAIFAIIFQYLHLKNLIPGSPAVAGQLAVSKSMHYVYCIFNKQSNKIYVGQTNNLTRRLEKHNYKIQNKGHFTAKFSGQWDLVYKEEFKSRSDAIVREKQLKSHRGREFLKSIINPG